MRVLCVLNPRAAGGLAIQRWPSVAALMQTFGMEYELFANPDGAISRHLSDFLDKQGIGSFGAIAGIGGDGTHSAIINCLVRYREARPGVVLPPYAFVPLGTGNDIAKSFGLNAREHLLATDLRRAVSTILHGADYQLDLGVLNGTYFADALTIGLDSHILHERNLQKKRIELVPGIRLLLRGNLLYTLCMGKLFWRHDPLDVRIAVDGVPWYSGPILNTVVNNTRIYAGEFDLSPDAYADDGRLDVALFTGHTDYLRRYILAMRYYPSRIREFSERLSRMSHHAQGRDIEIVVSRPEAAQLDGEEIPAADTFRVGILPKAIHNKTPAEPI